MASDNKIERALMSAILHLESAESALSKKVERSFEDDIWHVGAELEYALFLFKILIHPQYESPNRRLNLRKMEEKTDQVMSDIKNLLNQSLESVKSGELYEAFKSASSARDQVLIIQKYLGKKRRHTIKYR